MISYDSPGAHGRLAIARVRKVAPFILVAMPVGWTMLLASGDFHAPLGLAGLAIYMAGFLACFLIIPTGVQRIAAGLPQGLDEMQLAARFRAQSNAYRWFSLWVLAMAIALELGPAFSGRTLSVDAPAMTVFFLWVIAWSVALPAFFLARALPPGDDEPE